MIASSLHQHQVQRGAMQSGLYEPQCRPPVPLETGFEFSVAAIGCRAGTTNQLRLSREAVLDGQTLATLGATSVDHSTAAAGFHANQKTVSAGAFDLGGLVSAFHFENPKGLYDNPP